MTATAQVCAFSIFIFAAAAAYGAGDNGSWHYELRQNSAETEDLVTVSFNQAALRMVWPKRHLVLVATAPKWQVILFNETTKRKYLPTPEQLTEFGFRSAEPVPKLFPPIKEKKELQSNLSVTAIDASAGNVELDDDDEEQFFQASELRQKTKYLISYHYIVWNEAVPQALSHILQCVYRTPLNPHLPLYFRRLISDGRMRYELSTNKVEKLPGPVNAKEPVGYTITHDPGPVVMGDHNDEVTNMGQQWFDADNKTAAAKAPAKKAPGTTAPPTAPVTAPVTAPATAPALKVPAKSPDHSVHAGH